jgi:cob(I)alamin adenosyltransferase
MTKRSTSRSAGTRPHPRILIFTGDGKGKTTAALGMVLRASGHGLRTLVVQFMKKDSRTGEIATGKRLRNVRLVQTGLGFVPPAGSRCFAKHRAAAKRALQLATRSLKTGRLDLVVLDELCTAHKMKLVDEASILRVMSATPANVCLVLTGRGATPKMKARADTVTEMRCIKHGYRQGIRAQKGVEF